MASSFDLGSVYATLKLKDDFSDQVKVATAKAQASFKGIEASSGSLATGVSNSFGNIANSIGSILKPIAAVGVVGGLGFGALIKYGFESTREIQKTTAGIISLTGSADEAGKVINQMIQYVQGKPFDRLEVIQATRQLLAMGRTTKDLTGDIELIGRAVVLTGGNFADLAKIYGIAASSNRIMSGELNQLESNGIPIVKNLGKVLGLTAQGVRELAEKGEIDFATFRKAMELSLPADIVKNASNTIDNQMKSLSSSFRNLAFDILGVDFSKIDGKPLIKVGGLLDKITIAIQDVIKKLRAPEMRETFKKIGESAANVATKAIPLIVNALLIFGKNMDKIILSVIALTAAWAIFKALSIASTIVSITLSMISMVSAVWTAATALGGAAGAMQALNVAMALNPVGIVVAAIIALVAIVVALQLKFNILGKTFDALKPVLTVIARAFGEVWDAVKELGDLLGKELAPAFEFVKRNSEAFKEIGKVLLVVVFYPLIAAVAYTIGALKLLAAGIRFVSDHFEGVKQVVVTTLKVAFYPLYATIESIKKLMEIFGIEWNDVWTYITNVARDSKSLITKYIDDTKNSFKDFGDKIEDMKGTLDDFKQSAKTAFENFKESVSNNTDKAKGKLDTFLDRLAVAKNLIANAFDGGEGTNNFVAQIDIINDKLAGQINSILKPYQEAWKGISDGVSKFIDELPLKLEGLGESFATAFGNAKTVVQTKVVEMWWSIQGFIDGLPQQLVGIWWSFQQAWDTAKQTVTTKILEIWWSLQGFIDNLDTQLVGIWQAFGRAWDSAYKNTVEFFKGLPEKLKPDVEKAGEDTGKNTTDGVKKHMTAIETIRKVGDAILTMIGLAILLIIVYLLDAGLRAGRKVIEGLVNGIREKAGDTYQAIKYVSDQIGNFFSGAWNWLFEVGRTIIRGLVNGIKSMFGDVKSTLGDLTAKIKSWKGPEAVDKKLLVKNGQTIIGGLVTGLESQYGTVKKSLQGLTDDISNNGYLDLSSAIGVGSYNLSNSGVTAPTGSPNGSPVNIYGNITISNQADADYLLSRLSRRQDLTVQGLVGA